MSSEHNQLAIYSNLKVGEEVGASSWIVVDQTMITGFGMVTLDPEPLHVDPEWAAKYSPYGGTIAFGFLTMSLLTAMIRDAMGIREYTTGPPEGHYLNYGIDKLRLLQPIPVDSRVRGRFRVIGNRVDEKGRNIVTFNCEVEVEGSDRPALVAEWLSIYVAD